MCRVAWNLISTSKLHDLQKLVYHWALLRRMQWRVSHVCYLRTTCGPKNALRPYPVKLLILRIKVCVLRGLLLKGNFSWPFHFFCACMHAKPLQLWLTLCNPVDYSPLCSSVRGIHQATILEWVAVFFIQGSFQTQGSEPGSLRPPALAGRFFSTSAQNLIKFSEKELNHRRGFGKI